jgi:RNA polymerase-binding transcription factor DksA
MTTLDITDHDDWLGDMRERLRRACEEQTANLQDLSANTPDPGEASAHAALLAASRQSLADASEALTRMDQGRYGTCEACGAAIPAERLDIVPHARTCVSCRR